MEFVFAYREIVVKYDGVSRLTDVRDSLLRLPMACLRAELGTAYKFPVCTGAVLPHSQDTSGTQKQQIRFEYGRNGGHRTKRLKWNLTGCVKHKSAVE